jgi:hypothetical protein
VLGGREWGGRSEFFFSSMHVAATLSLVPLATPPRRASAAVPPRRRKPPPPPSLPDQPPPSPTTVILFYSMDHEVLRCTMGKGK